MRGEKSRVGLLPHQQNVLYQEAIDVLTSQGKFYINLGLERVQKILKILGNPEKVPQFIHVAGTNGKGSVCAMLSSILSYSIKPEVLGKREKGKGKSTVGWAFQPNNVNVGLFTSPHVFEYTERIKINDVEIEKEVFAKKVINIAEFARKNDIHLTEFEILTVVAFEYFAENDVDVVILETGLGGRLDATNVIEKNLCSIITNIDFDHTERLGDTIEKIAYEKAGIIKENCPVVVSRKNSGFKTIKKFAQKRKSGIFTAEEGPNFLPENSALQGYFQQENLALVLKAIELLKEKDFDIPQQAIRNGLKNVKHPCRFEYLKEYNVLVDGAHNPNGTKALRESLNYYFKNQKIKFIFGCLKNKNYAEMMKNLFNPAKVEAEYEVGTFIPEIYFYEFNNENACKYEDLAKACEFDSRPFNEFKKDNNVLTVVCGSFYMIKELLPKMGIK